MAAKMPQTINNKPDEWQYSHLSDSVKYKKWILNNIIFRSGFQKYVYLFKKLIPFQGTAQIKCQGKLKNSKALWTYEQLHCQA